MSRGSCEFAKLGRPNPIGAPGSRVGNAVAFGLRQATCHGVRARSVRAAGGRAGHELGSTHAVAGQLDAGRRRQPAP